VRVARVVVASLALAGCGKKHEPAAEGSSSAAPATSAAGSATPIAAPRPARDPNAPHISIAVTAATGTTAYSGWPLLVVADLRHPAAPITIRDWPSALALTVSDAAGKPVSWPWHLATRATGALELAPDEAGEVGWWLAPDDTAHLPAGTYRIRVALGGAHSETRIVKLQAPPATLDDATAAGAALRLAALHALQGDLATARADVNALLAKQPDHWQALAVLGDLAQAAGKPAEARDAYDRAIAAYPATTEPPRALIAKRRAIR